MRGGRVPASPESPSLFGWLTVIGYTDWCFTLWRIATAATATQTVVRTNPSVKIMGLHPTLISFGTWVSGLSSAVLLTRCVYVEAADYPPRTQVDVLLFGIFYTVLLAGLLMMIAGLWKRTTKSNEGS